MIDPLAPMPTYDEVYPTMADRAAARAEPQTTVPPATGPRLTFRQASSITPSRPTWLWDRWLEAGALHLLIGRQGGGKSTFAAWLMATASAGRSWPDEDEERPPVTCAILSLEESADRLTARLAAAGADLDRCLILDDVEDQDDEGRPFRRPWQLPADCEVLEDLLRQQTVGLVLVDGLGYSVRGDSHNYAVVGAALSALAGVGERAKAAIVGLTHTPKGSSDPVTAAIGSTAWTAIPRVTWVLGADPEDETEQRHVVRVAKTNHREPDNGLAFTISNDERYECGFVTGLTASSVEAKDLVAGPALDEDRSKRAEIEDVIAQELAEGPRQRDEVLKAIRAAGIVTDDRTVRRAQKRLGVVSKREGFGPGARYTLTMPGTEDTSRTTSPELSTMGVAVHDGPDQGVPELVSPHAGHGGHGGQPQGTVPHGGSPAWPCGRCGAPTGTLYGEDRVCAECFRAAS